MGYPRRLLTGDEELIFELHPHWRRLVLPGALAPLLVFLTAYGAGKVPAGAVRGPARIGIVVVGLLLLIGYSVVPILRRQTTHFVLTTKRVIMRSGIVARKGRDI